MSSWPPPEVGLRPWTVWTCQSPSRWGLHTAAVTRVLALPLMGFSQFQGPVNACFSPTLKPGATGKQQRMWPQLGCGKHALDKYPGVATTQPLEAAETCCLVFWTLGTHS